MASRHPNRASTRETSLFRYAAIVRLALSFRRYDRLTTLAPSAPPAMERSVMITNMAIR
jgi:hypothetical protein